MGYNLAFNKNNKQSLIMYVIVLFLFIFNIAMEQYSKLKDDSYAFLTKNAYESSFNFEYFPILMYLYISLALSFVLIIISYLFTIQKPDIEKVSSYECGFEPYEDARNPYSVKFYLIAILFIIFDIETMFLLPWCVSVSKLNLLGFWSMVDFVIELGIGYVYIWCSGLFEWE